MKIEIIDHDGMFDLYIDGKFHHHHYTKKDLLGWLDGFFIDDEDDDEEEIDWSDPDADE